MTGMLDADIERIAAILVHRMSRVTPVQPRLMDINEAARYLGRSPEAVRGMVSRGKIPVVKLDSKPQFDRTLLDRLIEAKTE